MRKLPRALGAPGARTTRERSLVLRIISTVRDLSLIMVRGRKPSSHRRGFIGNRRPHSRQDSPSTDCFLLHSGFIGSGREKGIQKIFAENAITDTTTFFCDGNDAVEGTD
jgi:hypothetical protein